MCLSESDITAIRKGSPQDMHLWSDKYASNKKIQGKMDQIIFTQVVENQQRAEMVNILRRNKKLLGKERDELLMIEMESADI